MIITFENHLYRLYAVLLCALFAIVFTGQILGFLSIYYAILVLPMVLGVFVVALASYMWLSKFWYFEGSAHKSLLPFEKILLASLFVLFIAIFAYRLLLFPQSSLGVFVADDLIGYHAPKAIELYRTGSMWDLSIVYGDYPNGYESILAFLLILTQRVESAGIVQLFIVTLFIVTLYMLILRFTRLSAAWIAVIVFSVLFVPFLYALLLAVGKNDLLLITMVLGAIFHAPLDKNKQFHLLGMAFTTFIAVATKANGIVVLSGLWLFIGLSGLKMFISGGRDARKIVFGMAIALGMLILPSGFWVLRNLVLMKRPFSPEVASFNSTSLLANLTNPLVYQSGVETGVLLGVLVLSVILGIIFVWRKQYRMSIVLIFMWVGFIATPLSAFHTPQSTTLHVEWRYATHLLIFLGLLLIVLLEGIFSKIYHYIRTTRILATSFVAITIVAGMGLIAVLGVNDLLGRYPENSRRFYEADSEPSGIDGYYSAYDYVRKNIQGRKIWYDIAQHFYLYGEGFSNQPNAGYKYPLGLPEVVPYFIPDYAVVGIKTGLQDEVLRLGTSYTWQEVYRDSQFIVYKRLPS